MCIALLIIYGLYCLLKDFFRWLGSLSATQTHQQPVQKPQQKPISMNELLTFEELLEDDN